MTGPYSANAHHVTPTSKEDLYSLVARDTTRRRERYLAPTALKMSIITTVVRATDHDQPICQSDASDHALAIKKIVTNPPTPTPSSQRAKREASVRDVARRDDVSRATSACFTPPLVRHDAFTP
jgi:hypothetical protein